MSKIIVSAIGLALASCASLPAGQSSEPSSERAAANDQLSARRLTSGECASFVWTADGQTQFILFSSSATQSGAWHDGTSEKGLRLTAESGAEHLGQYSQQSFMTSDGQALTLNLSSPQAIDTGLRYKSGLLTSTQADGWERVIPVIGLVSCYSG